MPARIRHSGERFHLVPPQTALRFAVAAGLLWLCLAGLGVYEYYQPGPAGENSLSNFAEWSVYATGYTLVCLLFLPGLATVVIVGKGGLALECWGWTRWHVPWSEIRGWQRQIDTNDILVGLLVVERGGRTRRLDLGWLLLSEEYYERLITASHEHAPALEDLPPVQVFRVHSGCLAVLALVGFFVLLYLALQALSPI